MLAPNILGFNVNQGILFLVGGIAQVFWIIPMVMRWGRAWYGIGIAGTAVFMALFFITRVPGNPITGRGGGANTNSILVEIFQGIFIGLAIAILIYESRRRVREEQAAPDASGKNRNKHLAILAGIVIALIVFGLFALPAVMPRPMGGPPGQGGGPPPGGQTAQPGVQPSPTAMSTSQACTLSPLFAEIDGTPKQSEGPCLADNMTTRPEVGSQF
jgi:hypothetical protein